MKKFNSLLFFFFGTVLSACAFSHPDYAIPIADASVAPSEKADITFAFLQMEQAMRLGDLAGLQNGANLLLQRAPSSRPLSDAAAWMLGNGNIPEARELLTGAVKALPDDLLLHIMLSETMLLQDETIDGAIAVLTDFAHRHPENGEIKVELALTYMKDNKPKDALRLFHQIPLKERSPMVYYYMSQAQKALGDISGAMQNLHTALAESPDFLEALLELALLEERQQNYATARKHYLTLLSYDQGNQDVQTRLAALYLKEKNASAALDIAIQSPDPMNFCLMVCSLLLEDGRPDAGLALLNKLAAVKDLSQAVQDDIPYYIAVLYYEGFQDRNKALAGLGQVSINSHMHEDAQTLIIQILMEQGKAEQALAVAVKSREIYPYSTSFLNIQHRILAGLGRYDEAVAIMEELLRLTPDDSKVEFTLAYTHELAGNHEKAMRLMETLVEKDPSNAEALNFIGYSLADENKDLVRAEKLIRQAHALMPDADFIMDSLAWVLYRQEKYAEAWQSILKAIELAGTVQDSVMWDHYGDIAVAVGNKEEARKGWENSLVLEDSDSVKAKLDRL